MKKLYRSQSDVYLGGVAGGLAEYLEVDPVFVRLVFFALAFTGTFILAYLAAWIFVPFSPLPPKLLTEE